MKSDKWYRDEIYEYDNKGLTQTILNIKKKRKEDLKLNWESYDFVILLSVGMQ